MSHPSSPCAVDRVNVDLGNRETGLDSRGPGRHRLLRRILAAERRIHAESLPRAIRCKPTQADEVLAALARAYQPGTRLDMTAIRAATGVSREVAASVRRWAREVGAWPYLSPLTGFAAMVASRRKGGAL